VKILVHVIVNFYFVVITDNVTNIKLILMSEPP